nr:hypothetical protein BaRGS_000587 [Batillaria attramentaria]
MATNASLYMLFASSTMAVKLLEPVTSSMIQSLVLKTKMSFESVLAMPVIIAGAFLFVGDPFQSSVVTDGIVLALFSNVVLGPNIHDSHSDTRKRNLLNLLLFVTLITLGTSTVESAHNELMNGLLFLQRGRVVVTDRLHGHILCVLLNIPHVLLDNADNKLSSYYNTWTRGLANTRLTDNPQDAARLAMKLLETYGEGLPPTLKSYQAEE